MAAFWFWTRLRSTRSFDLMSSSMAMSGGTATLLVKRLGLEGLPSPTSVVPSADEAWRRESSSELLWRCLSS